jgi:branched-chain amino acid transport system ATP-binding protein
MNSQHTPPMSCLLDVASLHAGYGRMQVVKDLSLHLAAGESLALLGPNGHGKTTALRAITGLGRITSGQVIFDGKDITGKPAYEIVREGLMHIPQASHLFPRLTVRENLLLAGRLPRAKESLQENLEMVQQLFPKLAQRRDQLTGTLSGGERQMVAIGMGLMASPKLLILDEPTLGLAPKVRYEILETLRAVRETGLTLIVADGDVDFLFELTDRWQLVEMGRIVASGSTANRPSNEEMMNMFIGSHAAPAASPDNGEQHA